MMLLVALMSRQNRTDARRACDFGATGHSYSALRHGAGQSHMEWCQSPRVRHGASSPFLWGRTARLGLRPAEAKYLGAPRWGCSCSVARRGEPRGAHARHFAEKVCKRAIGNGLPVTPTSQNEHPHLCSKAIWLGAPSVGEPVPTSPEGAHEGLADAKPKANSPPPSYRRRASGATKGGGKGAVSRADFQVRCPWTIESVRRRALTGSSSDALLPAEPWGSA